MNPDPIQAIRIIKASIKGAMLRFFIKRLCPSITINNGLKLFGKLRLPYCRGCITIGKNAVFGNVFLSVAPSAKMEIGDNCSFNDFSFLVCNQEIMIGNDVLVAEGVSIRDFDHCFSDADGLIREQGFRSLPIYIGDDVWIGKGATILKGTRIGRGSVIGANSVVTKDIPDNAIAVGAPARVIRMRGRNSSSGGCIKSN